MGSVFEKLLRLPLIVHSRYCNGKAFLGGQLPVKLQIMVLAVICKYILLIKIYLKVGLVDYYISFKLRVPVVAINGVYIRRHFISSAVNGQR